MALEATIKSASRLNRFGETVQAKEQELQNLGARGGYARRAQAQAMQRYRTESDAVNAISYAAPMDFFATFFLMLPVAILLDIIDLVEVTGVGLIIVIALKLTLGALLCLFMYFAGKDASGNVGLAVALITFVTELIPGVDILPITTIAVFVAYTISTPEFQKRYQNVMARSLELQKLKRQIETGVRVGKRVARVVKK